MAACLLGREVMADYLHELIILIANVNSKSIAKYYFITVIPISLCGYVLCTLKIMHHKNMLLETKVLLPSERQWALRKKLDHTSIPSNTLPDIWIEKQIRHHYCIIFSITIGLTISFVIALAIMII